jgi:hypothetical protein
MKPIPQEKCIIIRTIGRRTRSAQLFPINSEAILRVTKYPIGGIKNQGDTINVKRKQVDCRMRLKGAAKYRKFAVPL